MTPHPYFNLVMHQDDELAQFCQETIIERKTIHEWPLSCVQLITLESGVRKIYKSQYGPTVEADFLSQAHSPLLPQSEILYHYDGYQVFLLEYLHGTLLEEMRWSEEQVASTGRQILHEISKIQGTLPVHTDIGSPVKWEALVTETLSHVEAFIGSGQFHSSTVSELNAIHAWALSPVVCHRIAEESCLIHGDLTRDNVFVCDDGLRVIDWQRPSKAPAEVDLVALLNAHGGNPCRYVAVDIVGIFHFLQMHWAVECQRRWIVEASYDEWVHEAIHRILALLS